MMEKDKSPLQEMVDCLGDILNLDDAEFQAFAQALGEYDAAWQNDPINSEFELLLPDLNGKTDEPREEAGHLPI